MKLDIKKLFENLSTDKVKRNIIIAIGIAGILLIFLSDFIHTDTPEREENEPLQATEPITAESYCDRLEKELSEIVSQISGAGVVNIMITMDSTTEEVYAVERSLSEQTQSESDEAENSAENEYKEENVYVTLKNKDGSEEVVLLKQIMPKIRGVLVVCEGGGDSVVREKITQAVSGVLNISSSKVYVTN